MVRSLKAEISIDILLSTSFNAFWRNKTLYDVTSKMAQTGFAKQSIAGLIVTVRVKALRIPFAKTEGKIRKDVKGVPFRSMRI